MALESASIRNSQAILLARIKDLDRASLGSILINSAARIPPSLRLLVFPRRGTARSENALAGRE